jgi:flavin reductase (DIM6/NTAB) family NADH-FMN oxidoreductase RutF
MDITALFNMSYGLYILATRDTDGRLVGCAVNCAAQASAEPPSMLVGTNIDNYTTAAILRSGAFTVSILSEKATLATIGVFGFRSSKDLDKFSALPHIVTEAGMPVLTQDTCGYVECRVTQSFDSHTHKIIVGDIVDAKKLNADPPMTYDYYHRVVKGKTPKNAVSYVANSALA